MKFLLLFFLFSPLAMACLESVHSPIRVTLADFPFSGANSYPSTASFPYRFNELHELYEQSYRSQKRLTHHAYKNTDGQWHVKFRNQALSLPQSLLDHLISSLDHFVIERKIRHLYFPDAGHAHILLPASSAHYNKSNLTPDDFQDILESQNFAILLHTREQVDFFDPQTLHPLEFQERNLFIDFSSRTKQVLRLEDHDFGDMFGINRLEGYDYTSFSFYFHAHERGCMKLNQSNINFDLSLRFH
jgi:hypothetical protein